MRLPVIFPQPTPETLARYNGARSPPSPAARPFLSTRSASPASSGIAARERERIRWVEIFHHPMVADLAPDDPARDTIAGNEREALALARLVIATSHATARWLGEHGIARQRLVTARPGLDRFTPRSGPGAPGPLRLLSVGAVVPRKDYIRLIGALAHVAEQPDWRLDIVGNPDRDPAYAAKVRAMIDQCGLAARITLRGRLEDADLAELWAGADVYAAIYPLNLTDDTGKPLDGANKYTIHFDKGATPPVAAFWSITLYDQEGYQVANPVNRFAVSSWMPFKANPDGSLDLYFQTESPGKDKEWETGFPRRKDRSI